MTMHIQINITASESGEFTGREHAVLAALYGVSPAAVAEAKAAAAPAPAEPAPTAEAEQPEAEEKPKRRRSTRKPKDEQPVTLQEELDQLGTKDEKAEAAAVDAEAQAEADAEAKEAAIAAAEPEATEEAPDANDAEADPAPGKYTMDDAVAKVTKLVAERKAAVVKSALAKLGVGRVGELSADQVDAFMTELEG